MKQKKESLPNKFVTAVSPIVGLSDDEMFVKRQDGGYIGAIKVPGIDIFSFKDTDREMSMSAFGNALSIVEIPTKYVCCGCKSDYSQQKSNLAKHELTQEDEFRRHILERERSWLEYYEKNEEMRSVFVLFYSKSTEIILDNMKKYIACLSQGKIDAQICKSNDFEMIFKILLNGGCDDD